MKWNLGMFLELSSYNNSYKIIKISDILEQNLNSQKQLQILIDLCSITSGNTISLPFQSIDCSLGPDGSKHALHFAMTLYHRWVVRTAVNKDLQNRIKPNYGFKYVRL